MHKNNNKTKLNANESHTSKFLECIISTTTAIATKKSNYDCSLFSAFFKLDSSSICNIQTITSSNDNNKLWRWTYKKTILDNTLTLYTKSFEDLWINKRTKRSLKNFYNNFTKQQQLEKKSKIAITHKNSRVPSNFQ